MVFESLLVQVLNNILGDYVENLDTKQLNVGIWGGDVLLKNLQLKQSALNNLDLPIQTIYGKIGKLVLKIPWKNLYGAAFIINVEDIYLIAAPNTQTKYNAEKERIKALEAKRILIKNVEIAKKMEQEKEKVKTNADFTFVEKLITQIIKNLQLNIKNIHIRYEDKMTDPKSPFALGLTLGELNVVSTDDTWEPKITQENISKIFKIVSLDSLAVYWNCNTKSYAHLSVHDIVDNLTKDIAKNNDETPDGYSYILGPINASAKLKLNQKPEQDEPAYTIPKINLNLDLKKLYVGLSRSQYKDIIALMNAMNSMIKADPYRKYRPDVPTYRGHYKEWWKFAFTCVLEGEIRRRRRNWDWNHICEHRNRCREYQAKYLDRILNSSTSVTNVLIDELEESLDIFNIVIIRQRVELEAERLRKVEASKPKKSWLGWMWSSAPAQSSDEPLEESQNDSDDSLSLDEKRKLYKALDYHEGTPAPTYPENYIDISATFLLRTLEFEIKKDQTDTPKTALFTELKGVKCQYDSRASAKAIKVHVKIDEFTCYGLEQEDYIPNLITSETGGGDSALLEVTFETNPLDKKCDQRLNLIAQPIKIIYDAITINEIFEIFRIDNNDSFAQFQTAASEQVASFKEKSSISIQHTIEQHTLLDVKIDLQAPIVLIPYGGKYTPYENLIVLNLGNLKVYTADRPPNILNIRKMLSQGREQADILKEMIDQSYDQFELEFTNLQILLVQGDEDWQSCLKESRKTEMHLLIPVSLNLTFYKCLINNDPRLPLTKIKAELPSINVTISNAKIILVYSLINSIPLPTSEILDEIELNTRISRSSSKASMVRGIITIPVERDQPVITSDTTIDEFSSQMIRLEIYFVMKELSLTMCHQDDSAAPMLKIATMQVENLQCELTQKKYLLLSSVRLAAIQLKQYRPNDIIDIISIPNAETEDLFNVKYLQVDDKAPDFHTTYESCKTKISANVSVINFNLHQEGLIALIQFQTQLLKDLEEYQEGYVQLVGSSGSTTLKRRASIVSNLSQLSQHAIELGSALGIKLDTRPDERSKSNVVNLKLKFRFKELKVLMSTDRFSIAEIGIKGISAKVQMLNSKTSVKTNLQDIVVHDLNPSSVHKTILSVVGEETLKVDLEMIDNKDNESPDEPDIILTAQMGGLKILFLNWFVTNILNFINNFQDAKEAIIKASADAAEAAKLTAQEAYEKATKIALNIDIKAPDIIVPIDSKSMDGIGFDMGHITITNRFNTLNAEEKYKEMGPVIIDRMRVTLTNLKLSKVKISGNDAIDERVILEPLSSKLVIKRNLTASWYKAIPDIDMSGNINEIKVKFSHIDMATVTSTLKGNLSEGGVSINAPAMNAEKIASNTTFRNVGTLDNETSYSTTKKDEKVYTSLRFTITMDKLEINLHTGGDVEKLYHLGRFSLEGLSCKGRTLSDGTFSTSMLLLDCNLDDMRPGRDKLIRRLIERKHDEVKENMPSTGNVRSMLDITFQQKGNEMFADVRVFSFTFIFSAEYMLKLMDFFNTTLESSGDTGPAPSQILSPPKQTSSKPSVTKSMATSTQQAAKMTINLKLEKPDIIIVEHMDNIDTSAIILHSEIQIKYRAQDTHQVINGTIKDMQLVSCNYNPEKRHEHVANILFPITISVAGSTPQDKGLHLELLFTDIRFSLTPSTIGLLSNISSKFSGKSAVSAEEQHEFQYNELWQTKPYQDDDFWYLKTDTGIDVVEIINSKQTEVRSFLEELCIVNMPSMIFTLEAGEGQKTLPMLLFESSFNGNVRNWSSQLSIDASLNVMMGYYNSFLALWEPLIEPVQHRRTEKVTLVPWELTFELCVNNPDDQSAALSPDSDMVSLQIQPITSIFVSSESTLELTMTKTCLHVLTGLASSFSSAMEKRDFLPSKKDTAFKFINELGTPVTLLLNDGSFRIAGVLDDNVEPSEVILENGAEVNLEPKQAQKECVKLSDVLISQSYSVKSRFLNVKVNDMNCTLELPVTRADTRFFMLKYKANNQTAGVISESQMVDGVMTLTLRSILQVENHFNVPIEIYILINGCKEMKRIAIVEPHKLVNIPLSGVYTTNDEFFFAADGFSITSVPFVWKELQTNFTTCKLLQCEPRDLTNGTEPFTLRVIGIMRQVFYEHTLRHTMASTCYNVHLRPAVSLKNYIPIPIICCVENIIEEFRIEAGDTLQLPNCLPGQSVLVIRLENYLDKEWSCRQVVMEEMDDFSVWTFNSYDGAAKVTLNLGVHRKTRNQTIELELYCPFWMLNKTGLFLSYKSSDDVTSIIHHPPNYNRPILFSFHAKNFFSKKKASVRVKNGVWSDKFSLDVAGSSGVIVCKNDDQIYQIGVTNIITNNGLTKQVTFTPYYVIINNTTFPMEFQESIRPADHWLKVEPESCESLWPVSEDDDKLLRLRICGTDEISKPFLYTESHTTLLRTDNKYGGVNVDIQITEGGIYISLASYGIGMAPALIINHTRDDMNFWEKQSVKINKLKKRHSVLFTWENPSGPRILVWECGNRTELENDLRRDEIGEYTVGNKNQDSYKIYWVSFLDGMQRVLLFTEDSYIAENVQSAKHFEAIDRELTISLHGLGISLIDNTKKKDVMYMGITSSGVIWETCKMTSNRFKYMSQKDSVLLETAYQEYLQFPDSKKGTISIHNKMEVDFSLNLMYKPNKRKIKRSFQTAVWFQQKSSSSQLQLHAKINHLQIDNQLPNSVFPVVLATVNPPKSLALNTGIRPFAEMSIVQLFIKNSQVKQFKYFKILIQEFHVKVEMGFLNAMLEIVAAKEYTEQEEKNYFKKDIEVADEQLYIHVSTQALQEQKSFYDVLHFSPLKIHVSFSMGTGVEENTETSNFINVILSTVGVTVTDMHDVIFKLAFFEREYTFLTQKQLIDEASKHYVGQLLKQLYVLVLGLDVLGNPYGLVLGITKGVEDLFYEPFQGAIQGPGEFAEGIALGVRSLFGHTVGGAAGAVSRITGAMGKGVAALTFDDEYQRKRRDQISKKPTSIQEGFARSGKGLVMGVFDGVTGVVTKPISGAKEEGVGGFFKGLGKGAVGLFARPTSGVIDFASGSLDAVKRAADLGEEATRLRPPRFIQADGFIKPYNKQEAEGFKLLIDVDKGKYAKTDIYVYHYQTDKKSIMLLTDQRLAFVVYNEMFGVWQVDWSYTWGEITSPVTVVPKGVLIPMSNKKKSMFGSNDNGKIVLIENPVYREVLCQKIESLRGNV